MRPPSFGRPARRHHETSDAQRSFQGNDRLLDLGELRSALAPHYSPRGRPSVDPELLIRMALIVRIYAITSERRLCEEVRYKLGLREQSQRPT